MSHASNVAILAPKSPFYQGPFGRLFPNLPAWRPPGVPDSALEQHFLQIANADMVEFPGVSPGNLLQIPTAVPQPPFDAELPAGYVYFGQFVDHDITFDPASLLMRANDPSGLLNHRTPRLDLDSLYGRGPADAPFLYDRHTPANAKKFLLGAIAGVPGGTRATLPDLPRNTEQTALTGDPRNDENAFVAQLHLACLLAHNTLVDRAVAAGMAEPFNAARKTLLWLYQWVVWHDFLGRIVDPAIHALALRKTPNAVGGSQWESGLKAVFHWKNQPFMPVEFSVAAYRFGHSMVRNAYQTNSPIRGFGNFAVLFDNSPGAPVPPDDLRGGRTLDIRNYVQWDWFLPMQSSVHGLFPQRARKLDTKLSNALAALHEGPAGSPMNVLAFRNLLRGVRLELPSGSDTARQLGLTPIAIPPDRDSLWFYCLLEAETNPSFPGERLGAVGSTIVAAVFAGLLTGDPNAWVNVDPAWTPDRDPLLQASDRIDSAPDWCLSSIIRLAGLPVDGGDF
ncbi:heme peroxidase [Tahibacter aquaticus]|uniref:Heme peroxidase n=1 Tax=Tahibacter aquaticus TaxID=520092 RepID=A0A4R6YTW9_9GAMM|nr:peroxidase family protein [Tahibacter aquaticus]TDR41960.1 heme peroxidase [Tahibacter aquaticus]